MRAVPLLPLLLGGWLALPVHADDAQDMLQRLAQVDQQQNYQGTFVYERNGSFSSHRIWHRVAEGKIQERLLQLDGSAQEVLRVDGITQCVSGMLEAGVVNASGSSSRAFDVKRLSAWYDMKIVGKSRVAGRPTTIVALTPKDQHRYGVELHIDNETGLALKSLLLSDKGQLLERFQFTDLTPAGALPAELLQTSADCKPVSPAKVAKPGAQIAPVPWRSDWLPPGFELSSSGVRKDPDSHSPVTSMMYSDGLARFSVFIEGVSDKSSSDIRTQLGPTVAVSRRLTTPQGDTMVTVVGEIPLGTAERIALSIRDNEVQTKTQ